ncbi:hypothetical protein COCON_G00064830 [Conger conger]|uniref:Uncharacterized protein n=1 Tax=Conger conger TaxID=82655 RepID=A0A9Q1DS69_CONCO|nr:hypothetical protein COCON_G00064830 [Conger conger]
MKVLVVDSNPNLSLCQVRCGHCFRVEINCSFGQDILSPSALLFMYCCCLNSKDQGNALTEPFRSFIVHVLFKNVIFAVSECANSPPSPLCVCYPLFSAIRMYRHTISFLNF